MYAQQAFGRSSRENPRSNVCMVGLIVGFVESISLICVSVQLVFQNRSSKCFELT